MRYRLFFDECLSPELVEVAIAAGHAESTCARDRGMLGVKDWTLVTHVVAGDFTLVTNNAPDFRGAGRDAPGGLHAAQPIHAGLICLNSAYSLDLGRQHKLLRFALEELDRLPDLINQALEIFEEADGAVWMELYDIPP
jgi:hypothetical protein